MFDEIHLTGDIFLYSKIWVTNWILIKTDINLNIILANLMLSRRKNLGLTSAFIY